MEGIELAEMLKGLRSELSKAKLEGEGDDVRFLVGDVELEIQVGVSQKGGVGGKVDFLVYSAEASGELAKQTTQKIKLKLTPGLLNSETGIVEPMDINAVDGLPK